MRREPTAAITAAHPIAGSGHGGRANSPAQQDFRFKARKGQKLVFEVQANRSARNAGFAARSSDADGKPVERATIRACSKPPPRCAITTPAPSAASSPSPDSTSAIYIMMGGEIFEWKRCRGVPTMTSCSSHSAASASGMLDTTPEAHALDKPVYKMQIHPPAPHLPRTACRSCT